jgi:hypothetical protein
LYQDTTSSPAFTSNFDPITGLPRSWGRSTAWGFKGFARAGVLGSTLGGLGGAAYGYFIRPSPKKNMLLTSGIVWGTIIGSEFGGGASRASAPWSETNDAVGLGGLIGYNLGLAGTLGASLFWTPSWSQLGWMWGGMAIGTAASLPVYLFYINSTNDPRRGLIFQGVAGTLGVIGGAFLGRPDAATTAREERDEEDRYRHGQFARFLGASLMPVPGGVGASAAGVW